MIILLHSTSKDLCLSARHLAQLLRPELISCNCWSKMFVFRITIIACFFLYYIYAEGKVKVFAKYGFFFKETTTFPCIPCSVCNEEVTACDGSPNCVYNLTTGECQPKNIKPEDVCCLKKEVGDKSYTFLRDEDTSPYNCMNSCVYTEDGNPGSKVCFKEGDLATKCDPFSGEYRWMTVRSFFYITAFRNISSTLLALFWM